MQLAHFVTSLVFMLWRSLQLDELDPAFVQFQEYVAKLLTATSNNVTPPVILTSLKYLERLRKAVGAPGAAGSEFRIWVTALSLADAFVNDNAYTAKSWADVSGIPPVECVSMRKEFLAAIGYNLYVTEAEYADWLRTLETLLDPAVSVASSVETVADAPGPLPLAACGPASAHTVLDLGHAALPPPALAPAAAAAPATVPASMAMALAMSLPVTVPELLPAAGAMAARGGTPQPDAVPGGAAAGAAAAAAGDEFVLSLPGGFPADAPAVPLQLPVLPTLILPYVLW
nr:hypothetical protein HK105_004496 [Polyrhizophydium stewartii]